MMTRQCIKLLFCICLVNCTTASCYAKVNDTLLASTLHPVGRFQYNTQGDLELISSAVHFGFTMTGTTCSIYVYNRDSAVHNYIQYTLDGVYQKRIRIFGSTPRAIQLINLGEGNHIIWIYKATEAMTGPVFIEKIIAADIHALKIPKKPLIEFIGNSITCGAAADPSEIPCEAGDYADHHNAYNAYGPRLARDLNMDFILSSVSGIGIYRNWNSPGPTMPQVYEKTDFQDNSLLNWDFNTYSPRIVSIALGTNDFSEGDHKHERLPFDSSMYVSGYIQFVQLVKSKYPKARIILLSSPMLNGTNREKLQNCLEAVKIQVDKLNPSAKPVVLFFFEPMKARGCSGHPSVEDHAMLAKELESAFKKL